MKALTAAQMRDVDRLTTERYGVPSLQLMENAGTRVLEFLRGRFPDLPARSVVLLCGKGNNGGDGLVVARLLSQLGGQPEVLLFADPESVKGDAAVNLKRWQERSGKLTVVGDADHWAGQRGRIRSAELIVDALLGTGLTGPVEGLLRAVIDDVNQHAPQTRVVAVDIPSGLPSDGAIARGGVMGADATVTFTAPKVGLILPEHADFVGELRVVDIGSPAALVEANPELKLHWLEPGEFREIAFLRRSASHKGDFGHALILAGSRGKTGAAVLAAWGALRAGAGLVTVGTPANVLPTVASMLPEMMTEALDGTEVDTLAASNLDYGRLAKLTYDKSVLAMGPGLSTHPETQQCVRAVLAECALPVVLDADGLNAFVGRASELRGRHGAALAVTPHPGELARLCGCTPGEIQSRRIEVARERAADWNCHVILKGFRTVVATPDGRAFVNSTGNPGMATGGTGDVLTGILAGLTAQWGIQHWERTLSLGVYLHGLAGDLAAAQVGQASLMASDVVRALPEAFRKVVELAHG